MLPGFIDDEVGVEFTPGVKTGIYRFRFPASAHKALLFDVYNGDEAAIQFPLGYRDQWIRDLAWRRKGLPVWRFLRGGQAGCAG